MVIWTHFVKISVCIFNYPSSQHLGIKMFFHETVKDENQDYNIKKFFASNHEFCGIAAVGKSQ